MVRLALLLIGVVAALLWWGLPSLYVAIQNRHPLEITCSDYLKQRPDAKWLRLTHCEADAANVAFEKSNYGINKVYIPLRPEGGVQQGRTEIVVERDDKEIRDA